MRILSRTTTMGHSALLIDRDRHRRPGQEIAWKFKIPVYSFDMIGQINIREEEKSFEWLCELVTKS